MTKPSKTPIADAVRACLPDSENSTDAYKVYIGYNTRTFRWSRTKSLRRLSDALYSNSYFDRRAQERDASIMKRDFKASTRNMVVEVEAQ